MAVAMPRLNDMPVGSTVKIKSISGDIPLKRRMMDMGLTKGTEIYISKVAPLGDPMEINVRGYQLTLRKNDAEVLEVE